jgi:predicted ArsR family transcriptional regulator
MRREPPKQGTRRDILHLLKTEGPSDAGALAKRLGVTAMAVRQHLYDLAAEGLVSFREEPRPVGRPAKLWALTETADTVFPDAHADLALDLIGSIRATLGEAGIEAVIADRARRHTAAYRAAMADSKTLAEKLEALASLRTKEGYMAAVERAEDGFLLVENHCPICSAAKACSGLCAMELQVFADALGPDHAVERTDHILAGARRCAYRITSR